MTSLEESLTALANRFRSDKGTEAGDPHKYTFLYDLLFFPLKDKRINFLEMGLAIGGPEVGGPVERSVRSPSIAMWLEYFSRANIYGFDISDFSSQACDRFTFIRGDSGRESDLKRITDKCNAYDVILDDASHASYHQQLAFRLLFDSLQDGGLYIIEDLHWQSPFFERFLPPVPKTAEFFDKFFTEGAYLKNVILTKEFMEHVRSQTCSYSAFPSFTGNGGATKQIILRKRSRN